MPIDVNRCQGVTSSWCES